MSISISDLEKCLFFYAQIVFPIILEGSFVERELICILCYLWFNKNEPFIMSHYFGGLGKFPMIAKAKLYRQCEDNIVAQTIAKDINQLLLFLDIFAKDEYLVSKICHYINQTCDSSVEIIEKKVLDKLSQLSKQETDFLTICSIARSRDTCTIQRNQISEIYKILQILSIIKNIKLIHTPENLLCLVREIYIYAFADDNFYPWYLKTGIIDTYKEMFHGITIQQITRKLLARGIIQHLQEKTPEITSPKHFITIIFKFFTLILHTHILLILCHHHHHFYKRCPGRGAKNGRAV
jgi:hypothetical protein